MKKLVSCILAVALLLGVCVLPVSAADAALFDAKKQSFVLNEGPEIIRLRAESDENGTQTWAYVRSTPAFDALGERYYANFNEYDELYAEELGMDPEKVNAYQMVSIQLAYSFDGKTWVNDLKAGDGNNPVEDFDLDEDGFNEYVQMPSYTVDTDDQVHKFTVFDGANSDMIPRYFDEDGEMTIREMLTRRNNAVLQGKGEFTGKKYDKSEDDGWHGFAVDFSKNTLYVKARYRLYRELRYEQKNGEEYYDEGVIYSAWGNVKTFNNASASPEKQNCVPDTGALKTAAAPELVPLSKKNDTVERDGVDLKTTVYRMVVRFPDKMKSALACFFALDDNDLHEEYTGERYSPNLVVEIRVGDGKWYYLYEYDPFSPYFRFDDDNYQERGIMEELGYRPGDPVYLRTRLYGVYSYEIEETDNNPLKSVVTETEPVLIRSGVSPAVELSLTGKYNINYELNGGYFPSGTRQVNMFDEDSVIHVDLTAKDYQPKYEHHTFEGWYSDPSFANGTKVTSFDTNKKQSLYFYAKWKELPSYKIAYDLGVITDYVYNPNPDSIYPDSGENANGMVDIGDVSYEGAKFLGWYDAPTGGSKVTSLKYANLKKDVTLYARWELPQKTITYSGAGKDYTNHKDNPAVYRLNADGNNTVLIYAPQKTGFIFDGWFKNADLESDGLFFDAEKNAWLLNEREDVTLYAKWIRGRWPINYVLGGDDIYNSMNPEEYTYGTAVVFEAPTRTGFTFGGWFTDAACTKKTTGVSATQAGEVTVYAKWTATVYTVTYDLRDEKIVQFFRNDNPATRTIYDEIVLTPLVPVSKQYKFLGWYDNVNFDGKPIEKIGAGTDKNVTLYAKLYVYQWGDVNFDGDTTAADARLILRQSVDLENLPADALAWADLDQDGSILASDARYALRMSVDLESPETLKLPATPKNF